MGLCDKFFGKATDRLRISSIYETNDQLLHTRSLKFREVFADRVGAADQRCSHAILKDAPHPLRNLSECLLISFSYVADGG